MIRSCALSCQCLRFLEKRIASALATSKCIPLLRPQLMARLAPPSSLLLTSATDLPWATHAISSIKDRLRTEPLPSPASCTPQT